MKIIYHIRHRLTPRGGNQWYKDRSERKVSTYCGAAPTQHDAGWRDKAEEWIGCQNNDHPGAVFTPCPKCKKDRDRDSAPV